ncbi:MAG: CYTH domain-containing protein [Cyanosarcina radialis HA8281-LM2]|jgi:CYTH domain-containing protein|nr:CYTH domain-containing protein [Cyanosarcina radialis HA8281-LM2]
MAVEIERKFLVTGDSWRSLATGTLYRQGYIATEAGATVRIRLVGDRGYLTIKSKLGQISRTEYEYPIPASDAREMLDNLCERPLIEKTRYKIPLAELIWEIDEFAGENEGLILAEVELPAENYSLDLPAWIAREVSDDPRYFNANLVKYPFKKWSEF